MSQSSWSTISTLESHCEDLAEQFQFPSNYKLLGILGMGCFGMVFKCLNVDIQQVLAMKIQDNDANCENELSNMLPLNRLT